MSGTAAPARPVLALVPAEAEGSRPQADFLRAVVAMARDWNAPVHAVACGPAAMAAAGAALAAGADAAWVIPQADLATPPQGEQYAAAFHEAVLDEAVGGPDGPDLILFPVEAFAEECAARLAARLGGVALGRCIAIEPIAAGVRARRSAFGGRVSAEIEARGRPCVAALWPAIAAAPDAGTGAEARTGIRTVRLRQPLPAAHRVRTTPASSAHPDLEAARVIVCGGRGVGGREAYSVLEDLAACLDGVVGGSLPAADAGWIPVSRQIGQSGKHVAPDLYVAVGLSGTPQHLAGIDPRTRIVAVNRDPDAPIFRVSEAGAVGDWQVIVPRLIEALRRRP